MKIAVISTIPVFPCNGGNRARIANFVSSVRRLGHDVHFILLPSRQITDVDVTSHSSYFSEARFSYLRRGKFSDFVYYANRTKGRLLRYLKRGLKLQDAYHYALDEIFFTGFLYQLRKLARQHKFEAVCVEYVYNSKALEAFPDETLKIIDTHDSYSDVHQIYSAGANAFRGYSISEANQARGFLRADAIMAIQAEEAQSFSKQLGKKAAVQIFTVSHFLDLSHRAKLDAQGAACFIGSAFDANVKAIMHFFNNIWPLIIKVEPKFKLFVAGSICNAIPSAVGVVKLGFVPQVVDAFSKGPVAINPVLQGTGINIKLLDAMAAGVPSVSTLTGVRGLTGDAQAGTLVVDDADAQGFCDAVIQLSGDIRLRRLLGDAAYSIAAKWNGAQMSELRKVLSVKQKSAKTLNRTP